MTAPLQPPTETVDPGKVEESVLGTADELELETIDDLEELEYPSSDGVAMSETDFQARALFNARHFLTTHFKSRPEVYVSGNIFVYYDPNNSKMSVSPDILVAFEVPQKDRKTYKTWIEGKAPDFILEVLSVSTVKRDLERKQAIYASLGVREYFLFDPSGSLMNPPLQGYRLSWNRYERLPGLEPLAVRSRLLGLEIWVDEQRHLRMRDARTGVNLLSPEESETGRREAEERAERAEKKAALETTRAERAEARVKREEARVERAEDLAEQERARADKEARLRLETEARLAELEARLRSRS